MKIPRYEQSPPIQQPDSRFDLQEVYDKARAASPHDDGLANADARGRMIEDMGLKHRPVIADLDAPLIDHEMNARLREQREKFTPRYEPAHVVLKREADAHALREAEKMGAATKMRDERIAAAAKTKHDADVRAALLYANRRRRRVNSSSNSQPTDE